jgi:hypothetical protein
LTVAPRDVRNRKSIRLAFDWAALPVISYHRERHGTEVSGQSELLDGSLRVPALLGQSMPCCLRPGHHEYEQDGQFTSSFPKMHPFGTSTAAETKVNVAATIEEWGDHTAGYRSCCRVDALLPADKGTLAVTCLR